MMTPNDGMARAALKGITLRVQRRPGAPDATDDPLASTIIVDGALDDEMAGYADLDAMAMLGEESGEPAGLMDEAGEYPMSDMVNQNTVHDTAYIENDYPLAGQGPVTQETSPMDGLMGIPPQMMGGRPDPRKRAAPGIMKGLGF